MRQWVVACVVALTWGCSADDGAASGAARESDRFDTDGAGTSDSIGYSATGADSASSAGPDSGTATAPDGGSDTGSDSGSDIGPGSGTDTGVDSGTNTGVDSGTNSGADSENGAGGCVAPPPMAKPDGPPFVVGTGTPESCTSRAIQEGIDRNRAIVFDCGPDPVTIPVTETLVLEQGDHVSISGAGRITLDGRNVRPIMQTDRGIRLLIEGMRFINGRADSTNEKSADEGIQDSGGAIGLRGVKNKTPFIEIYDSVFENNTAHGGPFASKNGGGAIGGAHADVRIVRTVFRNNRCTDNCYGGGAYYNLLGNTRVYDSVFEDNTSEAKFGGAVYVENGPCCANWWFDGSGSYWCGTRFANNHGAGRGGAISIYWTRTTIEKCHFENNTTDSWGGALSLSVSDGEVGGEPTKGLGMAVIRQSSFVDNAGGKGAAIWHIGAEGVHIENSTFTGHDRQAKAVIFLASGARQITGDYLTIAHNALPAFARTGDGVVRLSNSILVDNGAGKGVAVCANTLEHNNGDCASGATDVDPGLAALEGDGWGAYFPLLPTSAALGQGNNCPPVDQVGTARSAACDLGAIEMP